MRSVSALRRARFEHGYSQTELAELTHISRQLLAHLEKGRRQPSLPVARRLARILGTAPDALFPDTDARLDRRAAEERAS